MLTRFTWPSQSALRVVRVSDIYPIAHKYNLPYHSQIVYNDALSVPIKPERPRDSTSLQSIKLNESEPTTHDGRSRA
jgi:hypothetical protein